MQNKQEKFLFCNEEINSEILNNIFEQIKNRIQNILSNEEIVLEIFFSEEKNIIEELTNLIEQYIQKVSNLIRERVNEIRQLNQLIEIIENKYRNLGQKIENELKITLLDFEKDIARIRNILETTRAEISRVKTEGQRFIQTANERLNNHRETITTRRNQIYELYRTEKRLYTEIFTTVFNRNENGVIERTRNMINRLQDLITEIKECVKMFRDHLNAVIQKINVITVIIVISFSITIRIRFHSNLRLNINDDINKVQRAINKITELRQLIDGTGGQEGLLTLYKFLEELKNLRIVIGWFGDFTYNQIRHNNEDAELGRYSISRQNFINLMLRYKNETPPDKWTRSFDF